MNDREVQFHAALLVVGSVNCSDFISFDPTGEPKAWRQRADRGAFMKHKTDLIDWLVANNAAGRVFSCSAACKGSSHAHTLSSDAALWLGEFYQWLSLMQGVES